MSDDLGRVVAMASSDFVMARAPFTETLEPWLAAAGQRLTDVPRSDQILTTSAQADLIAGLARELAFVAAPTLLDRFARQRGRQSFSPRSTAEYARFVRDLSVGGLDALCAALPELPRLIDVLVDDWCERAALLVERIERDRPLLRDHFDFAVPVAHAEPIIAGTVGLTDARGARVIYKHRPLGMDAAFASVVRWINDRCPRYDLFVPAVTDRGDFGWMAYVATQRPDAPVTRQRYLERTGMLLCVAHVLGAGDLHAGNIRAFGEYPVILDAEVMLRPRRAGVDSGTASVLTTGWLPTKGSVELSGLACEHYVREAAWVDVGTDAVRSRPQAPKRARSRASVIQDLRTDGADGVEALCRGFTDMYSLISEHGLPLDSFESTNPRVLLRPSNHYGDTIARSVQPSHLVSAQSRMRVVDELVSMAPPALSDDHDVASAVRTAERSALTRLEFPRFSMPATGGALSWRGQPLGSPFHEAPLARARRFVSEMSSSALDTHRRDIVDAIAVVTG